MSAGGIDRFDVEAMIRDASYTYATRDALHTAAADLREGIAELRDELATTHRYMQAEIDSLWRTLNARTEHLA